MIKFSEDFCKEVFFESVLQKFVEETGEKYAIYIKDYFPVGKKNHYNTDEVNEINDKRYKQEHNYTVGNKLPYFEGETLPEFIKNFRAKIKEFIENGDIDKKDKSAIDAFGFLTNYLDRLSLNNVKEVGSERKDGAISRMKRDTPHPHKKS